MNRHVLASELLREILDPARHDLNLLAGGTRKTQERNIESPACDAGSEEGRLRRRDRAFQREFLESVGVSSTPACYAWA
jgi:hypothetical protein